ncbi:MAG: ABC transporter permease [Planctomycetes bacterium]|nr:ABC transporter permease [Planctomycetota bacterium]
MPESLPRPSWHSLLRSRSAWLGMLLIGAFVSMAVAAEVIAPFSPTELNPSQRFQAPSAEHPLGTDMLGRDTLSRVIHGSRLSLAAGAVSVALAIAVGATAGAVAGYWGGWIDLLVMRLFDIWQAFPSILVALLVVVALPPGWTAVMLAVGLINVPVFCRQVRATVMTIRHLDYVTAARAAGAGSRYILARVVLPSLVNPIVVLATLGLGTAILEVAALSFLGIAGQPDDPEWGNMLKDAKNTLRSSVWLALAPGAAISLAVLGFNLLGDGLRDALDPRRP